MPKFYLYSTEIDPTTSPGTADPAPDKLVEWTQDPYFGTYEEDDGTIGRGSVARTLAGAVFQDFGIMAVGSVIRIAEQDAMTPDVVYNIKRLEGIAGGTYYFTDGYGIWEVAFSRTNSFKAFHNLLFAQNDFHIYSYELELVVISVLQESYSSVMTQSTTTTSTTTSTTSSTTTTTS